MKHAKEQEQNSQVLDKQAFAEYINLAAASGSDILWLSRRRRASMINRLYCNRLTGELQKRPAEMSFVGATAGINARTGEIHDNGNISRFFEPPFIESDWYLAGGSCGA